MKYKDLKDGQKVEVYIPAMNNFYRMEITDYDGKGAFLVSNYGCKKCDKIGGHETGFILNNQEDVDNFFYMHKGSIKQNELSCVTENAEEHYKLNKRRWIFQ